MWTPPEQVRTAPHTHSRPPACPVRTHRRARAQPLVAPRQGGGEGSASSSCILDLPSPPGGQLLGTSGRAASQAWSLPAAAVMSEGVPWGARGQALPRGPLGLCAALIPGAPSPDDAQLLCACCSRQGEMWTRVGPTVHGQLGWALEGHGGHSRARGSLLDLFSLASFYPVRRGTHRAEAGSGTCVRLCVSLCPCSQCDPPST